MVLVEGQIEAIMVARFIFSPDELETPIIYLTVEGYLGLKIYSQFS